MARYLCFDVGSKTIGIAKSEGFVASTLCTVRFNENNFVEACELLVPIIKNENPEVVVVGWPKNMNGSEGHRVEMVKDFILEFERAFPNVDLKKCDERLTTKMARSIMVEANVSRKKQKQNKDNIAAVLILETYLLSEKNK